VTSDELDAALEELEIRLERLRALYEQYFLGIEKIEPTVTRKDIDRRIWLLRREQIRNTARRFRLQTVVMRYSTFQQYWQRVCRDIENGTYVRHLLRAEKNVGPTEALTIAARKRLGMFRRGSEKRTARDAQSELDAARASGSDRPGSESPSAPPGAAANPPAPLPLRRAGRAAAEPPRPLEQLDMDFLDAKQPDARPPDPKQPDPRQPASEKRSRTPGKGLPYPARPNPLSRFATAGPKKPEATPPTAAAAGLSRPAADRAHRLAAPAAPRSPEAARAGLTDERVKELHARLVDAKRRVNDGGNVTMDGLAETLRAAETKLRQRHGDRRIDFDVVIKDGRAVVKPILR